MRSRRPTTPEAVSLETRRGSCHHRRVLESDSETLIRCVVYGGWSTQNASIGNLHRRQSGKKEKSDRASAPPACRGISRRRKNRIEGGVKCRHRLMTAVSVVGAMMEAPWSVRRARDAGEALRPEPSRRTDADTEDDDKDTEIDRDIVKPFVSNKRARVSPAPRLGAVVGLVTRRDRVAYVYCKRTNDTVPCVSIRIADDTFDGLRVVLWRAHAAADVGASPRRDSGEGRMLAPPPRNVHVF